MGKDEPLPPDDLIRKVTHIANTKEALPIRHRGVLNKFGVDCWAQGLHLDEESGEKESYGVATWWGPKLRFTLYLPSGNVTQDFYKPGKWEQAIKPTYGLAEFCLIQGLEETVRIYKRSKKALKDYFLGSWGVGLVHTQYSHAFRVAKEAVQLTPTDSTLHCYLSTLCFIALMNNRGNLVSVRRFERMVGIETATLLKLKYPDLFIVHLYNPSPPTLGDLGVEQDEAMEVLEFHAKEAIRFTESPEVLKEAKRQLQVTALLKQYSAPKLDNN